MQFGGRTPPALRGGRFKNAFKVLQVVEFLGVEHVDEFEYDLPLGGIVEALGVDVRSHAGRHLVAEGEIAVGKLFVEEGNTHAVSSSKVAHGGIPPMSHHLDHCHVVLVEVHLGFVGEESLPQNHRRQAARADRMVASDHLRLRGRVANARLALALSGQRETSSRAAEGQVYSGR